MPLVRIYYNYGEGGWTDLQECMGQNWKTEYISVEKELTELVSNGRPSSNILRTFYSPRKNSSTH